MKAKMNPDAVDNEGMAALMISAMGGNVEMVKQLLQQGAIQQLKSKDGLTAPKHATRNYGLNGLKIKEIDDNAMLIEEGRVPARNYSRL